MKEYGVKESWTKMCIIEYPKLKKYRFSPSIFLSNNGDVLVGYPEVINRDYWCMGIIYIESLVSPLSTEGLRLQQK
ncbi:hypothetical protein H5410_028511 [Solanum commersonii]|uniref:Uncharacterized protein n=1 Tax=Solanum commersonii TaxID=4109 RepID=A0A9J5Z258_SOLCO|nr:hypothetical protein H5410_028511 [Solanum commersonii]